MSASRDASSARREPANAPRDAPRPARDAWWLDDLGVTEDPTQGLSRAQAAAALARHGPNRLEDSRPAPLARQFAARLRNPLVLVLLVASAISALSGEFADAMIIVAIVLASATLEFVQEHRAQVSAEALRRSVSVRARVLREGAELTLPQSELVPGDLVLLAAGDLAPGDGRVLQARDCFVNQAMLTGEPYPVEKRPGTPAARGGDLHEATNAIFMGSAIIGGSARIRLVRTGAGTEVGRIAQALAKPAPPSAFELGTRRFGMMIMRLAILMVLFVLLANALMHRPMLESFLFAVALAVGLTPELLPMVVSVTLSRGALRLVRQAVIVKRQSALQDLGSMDVLCTDKTGTLTEARIRMERHVDLHGADSARVLEIAWLNSWFESGLRSPLDEAILAHQPLVPGGWLKIDEVPFDFERRRVSVLLEHGGARLLAVKGAPDDILRLCTRHETALGSQALDETTLATARATCAALEDEGFRVLAIASRAVDADHPHAVVDDESQLVLAGFAAFLDPPKASAGGALRALRESGVDIRVVTGDSDRVARHVCAQLGQPVRGVLTGTQIAAMDEVALRASVEGANLYCRVNPAQKLRVIQAIRAGGHVVGYLGDGVNDAPSLHGADIGLSVDSAVDVAKAAADVILLRQDLQVLHEAVLEGRRTFGNITKYLMMATSSNFGNMASMAVAALFLPFLPMLPTQVLLNNLLYDLSEVTLPFDAVDAEQTRRPHAMDVEAIRRFMLAVGPVSSVFDLLTFAVLLKGFEAGAALFQTAWFVESLCTQVLVIFVIRTRGNPLKSRAHPLLVGTSLAVVALGALLPFTALGARFGFVPLPAALMASLAGLVVAYLLTVLLIRQAFHRRHPD